MEAVLRGAVIYLFLLVLFRLAGRRSLANITTFDFVLLLIIAEATQQALLGDDYSITNALIVITTLIVIDIALSLLKKKAPVVGKIIDSVPLVIVDNGKPLTDRMNTARVEESDVLMAARESQGLKALDEIQYAVLEPNGRISIIPKK